MAVLSVSQARSARADAIALLTSISGKVEITKSQTRSKRLAAIGDRLFENDILQTRKNATASLLFTDGTIVKIFSNTRLSLTLKAKSEAMGSRQIGSLSKGILKGVKDIFSGETKKETLTAVPGIRKKIEEELGGVRVLYPRNSAILTTEPAFRWQTISQQGAFTVSLTLKGMGGSLWSIRADTTGVPYPTGKPQLKRGTTYFLRVENEKKHDSYDEIFFRIMDGQEVAEVKRYAAEMEDLRTTNPDDVTPLFLLANYYSQKGLHHVALSTLEALEKHPSAERFVLEQKMGLFFKMGMWKKWEEANQKLNAMK